MKRLQYVITELIRYIPLWLILIVSVYYTNVKYTEYKKLDSSMVLYCGTIQQYNKSSNSLYENLVILDTKSQKLINVFVKSDRIVKGYDVCGYDINEDDNRDTCYTATIFLTIFSFILLIITCNVFADILKLRENYE